MQALETVKAISGHVAITAKSSNSTFWWYKPWNRLVISISSLVSNNSIISIGVDKNLVELLYIEANLLYIFWIYIFCKSHKVWVG